MTPLRLWPKRPLLLEVLPHEHDYLTTCIYPPFPSEDPPTYLHGVKAEPPPTNRSILPSRQQPPSTYLHGLEEEPHELEVAPLVISRKRRSIRRVRARVALVGDWLGSFWPR